jgi:hypothetical protein
MLPKALSILEELSKTLEAIDYIANLPNIKGVAVEVSKKTMQFGTFRLLKKN